MDIQTARSSMVVRPMCISRARYAKMPCLIRVLHRTTVHRGEAVEEADRPSPAGPDVQLDDDRDRVASQFPHMWQGDDAPGAPPGNLVPGSRTCWYRHGVPVSPKDSWSNTALSRKLRNLGVGAYRADLTATTGHNYRMCVGLSDTPLMCVPQRT